MAQAYSYLGVAALQGGSLAQQGNDLAAARARYAAARDAFAQCIAQGVTLPEDRTLTETIIGGICRPYEGVADAALQQLGGGG